jgi:hypothetical protein
MTKKKVAYPVGLKVVEVRMMTKLELDAEGWENYGGGYPVAIIFEDGSMIYPSSDPEGNDVGCIFGMTKDGVGLIVEPLNDQMVSENIKA